MKTFFWVMLQTGNMAWQVIGTYRSERWAVKKAEGHRDQGRVQIRSMQPCGPCVYDSQPDPLSLSDLQKGDRMRGTLHGEPIKATVTHLFAEGVRVNIEGSSFNVPLSEKDLADFWKIYPL